MLLALFTQLRCIPRLFAALMICFPSVFCFIPIYALPCILFRSILLLLILFPTLWVYLSSLFLDCSSSCPSSCPTDSSDMLSSSLPLFYHYLLFSLHFHIRDRNVRRIFVIQRFLTNTLTLHLLHTVLSIQCAHKYHTSMTFLE